MSKLMEFDGTSAKCGQKQSKHDGEEIKFIE